MKILHVIPSLSPADGGPSVALPLMVRGLAEAGLDVDVVTTNDDGRGRRSRGPLRRPIAHDVTGYYFGKQTEFYKVSLPLARWLRRHVCDYDVVHIHALFSFASTAAAFWARRLRVPYIIRPLGVLNHWGTARRRPRLKALSFRFIEQRILRGAAAVHYTSTQEQTEAEAYGVASPAAVIPLGIDLGPFRTLPAPTAFLERYAIDSGRPIILFLARLDPKKGLDILLTALSRLEERHPRALLVIAGSGEPSFETALRRQAARLGVADRIIWTGFLDRTIKLSALAAASVYVLPSRSENFGMSLLEALAAGCPSVVAAGVALAPAVRECHAGIVVPCEAEPLAAALDKILSDPDLQAQMRRNAKRLVEDRYSLAATTVPLVALYHGIVNARQASH